MLNDYCTEKLLGLKDLILLNIENFDDFNIIEFKLQKSVHICPRCGNETSKVHDYRIQDVKDIPAFQEPRLLLTNITFTDKSNGPLKMSEKKNRKNSAKQEEGISNVQEHCFLKPEKNLKKRSLNKFLICFLSQNLWHRLTIYCMNSGNLQNPKHGLKLRKNCLIGLCMLVYAIFQDSTNALILSVSGWMKY